jgi:hypothetical protein
VRACEIEQGSISHALAFAYPYPSGRAVFPATKSDGRGDAAALPEGARLQLDPRIATATLTGWGCSGACLAIAHALQRYGMYVVDNGGRPKIMVEYEATAHWNGEIDERTVAALPLAAFRLVQPPRPRVRALSLERAPQRRAVATYTVENGGDASSEVISVLGRSGAVLGSIRRRLHPTTSIRPVHVELTLSGAAEPARLCVRAFGLRRASRVSCASVE